MLCDITDVGSRVVGVYDLYLVIDSVVVCLFGGVDQRSRRSKLMVGLFACFSCLFGLSSSR